MFFESVRTVQAQAPSGLATQSRKLQSADGDEIPVGIKIGRVGRAPEDFAFTS